MDTILDLDFQKKMNKEEVSPMIVPTSKKEKQTAMLSLDTTATEGEETVVVANGTINLPPISSTLTHGNIFSSLFSGLYNCNKNLDLQTTLNVSGTSCTQQLKKKMLKKNVCLFLLGWQDSAKQGLNFILFKHTESLLQNNKYCKMFDDIEICIFFKNDTSIKNLIVKTYSNTHKQVYSASYLNS